MQVRFYLGVGEPDAITSTWVHESIHARQPFGSDHEYSTWTGYEEGMTEGLTHRLLISQGVTQVDVSFPFYVTAYEEIARMLGIDVVTLWRGLWRHQSGSVRASFISIVNLTLIQSRRDILTMRQRERLQLATDTLFSTHHRNDRPDRRAIADLLKRVVQ